MLRSILVASCLLIVSTCLPVNRVKAEESTIISRLMVREGTIIVSQDSQGEIKYSLIDPQGNSIVTNLPEEQLAAQYPEVYNRLRPAVADSETSPWAGMLDY